jgi:hypothetical protein
MFRYLSVACSASLRNDGKYLQSSYENEEARRRECTDHHFRDDNNF